MNAPLTPKRWTPDDEITLIKLYKNGNTYDSIGKQLGRSPNAIKLRLEYVVYNSLVGGKKIDDVAKKLKTTQDKIAELYYGYKQFQTGRGKQLETVDVLSNNKAIQIVGSDLTTLKKLEYENKIMEAIVKNYKLKQAINTMKGGNKITSQTNKLLEKLKVQ